jgi:FAD:protein FMN transferase
MGDESVATTAAYDRDFIYAGVNYHHILDPRTGQPARGTQSVTVVHGDAVTATAAATALFVAGPKHWHAVAQAFGLRYVILVDSKGNVHLNPELHARLDIVDTNAELILSPPLAAPPGAPPTAGQPRSNPA